MRAYERPGVRESLLAGSIHSQAAVKERDADHTGNGICWEYFLTSGIIRLSEIIRHTGRALHVYMYIYQLKLSSGIQTLQSFALHQRTETIHVLYAYVRARSQSEIQLPELSWVHEENGRGVTGHHRVSDACSACLWLSLGCR